MPKASIIVPVFNKEMFLDDTLESLREQTLGDVEILLVDDASTDDSLAILRKHAERDPRFKILVREENRGLSEARNTGLDYAKGEYIFFWDADDIIEPDAVQRLVEYADKHGLDMARGVLPRTNGKRVWLSRRAQPLQVWKQNVNIETFPELLHDFSSCVYVVRKSLLERLDHRFRAGLYMQDVLFTLQLYLNAEKIGVTKIEVGKYLQIEESWSRVRSEERFAALLTLFDLVQAELALHPGLSQRTINAVHEAFINTSFMTFFHWKIENLWVYHDDLIQLSLILEQMHEGAITLYGTKMADFQTMYQLLALRQRKFSLAKTLKDEGRLPRHRELRLIHEEMEDTVSLMQTLNYLSSERLNATQVGRKVLDANGAKRPMPEKQPVVKPPIHVRAMNKAIRITKKAMVRGGLRQS